LITPTLVGEHTLRTRRTHHSAMHRPR